ncbi:PqqD family protein [Bacillus sp. MUM 13]|uniref:PqqD family protein n=1 Tax=Bacillus sp. MUM 13 TaxID=1678001 RepID=UPI0008F56874|nr:PqqD family protein [Bacillus sp. MUM 13]OIK12880.1 hypothetical protein BIV59_07375 [Bacillus sp. MUM 13]
MSNKRHSKKKNLLTMVPLLEDRVRLESDAADSFLVISRTNLIERFSIKFLKQPGFRRIKLDKFGAFAIGQMQHHKNVEQISNDMLLHFGEEADPSLPRLVKFLEILEAHDWLKWENEK